MSTQLKEALLRRREVEARTGLSRSTIHQLIREGRFPASIPLAGRTRCWLESDINRWIAERIAAARSKGDAV
jgi:prophage regulatory protein